MLDRRMLLGALAGAAAAPAIAAASRHHGQRAYHPTAPRPATPAPPVKLIDPPPLPALPQPDPALWDPHPLPYGETMAPGPNGQVYTRVHGSPNKTPVIVLHGGPAAGHRYMRPYAALATDRMVALYDQSGSGRSAAPVDLKRYTVETYVEELELVRRTLAFDKVVLIGHSWGGMLAPAYAAAYPGRVAAMVLAGTGTKWADFDEAAQHWLEEFGPGAKQIVAQAAAAGNTDDPAYGELLEKYYARHLCRLDPVPAWFAQEGELIGKNPVYRYMNGPSEFQFTGSLKAMDNTALLAKLTMPILVTCGEFDEAPPVIGQRLAKACGDAPMITFDGLSHMAHIEDPARVVGATGRWIRAVS